MTKEEYLEKKSVIDGLKKALDTEYITKNKEFNPGDRIKITDREGMPRIAEVRTYIVEYNQVVPVLVKVKKNGEASMISDNIWGGEMVEIIPEPTQ